MPNAAEFFGRLVSRMGLPEAPDADVLRERNSQRFLSGETKPPEVAERVLEALASTLVAHGYVPTAGWSTEPGFPTPAMLLEWVVKNLRKRWDAACVVLRSGSLRGAQQGPVLLTAARMLVIDLAVRAGAWTALVGVPLAEGELSPARPTTEQVMTRVIDESGLTAPGLAKKLGIERTAIDAWRKGARPSDASLGVIASLLTKQGGAVSAEPVRERLRRDLTIAEVLRDLAGVAWFAREVDDLWSTFWLLTRGVARRVDVLGAVLEPGIRPRTLTGLIMWGSGYEAALPLLHDLRQEASHAWQADLDAGPAWGDRLWLAGGIASSLGNSKLPDDLPEGLRKMLDDPAMRDAFARHALAGPIEELAPPGRYDGWHKLVVKNPPKIAAENRRMQASLAMSRGRRDEAITHLRRAVELVPDHDTAHFELGAAYWQAGFVEDGIRECRIAAALKPEWELPQVEIGIIFLNAKRFEEARSHLEAVYAAAKAPTSHLKFNLGSAKWRCGLFAEGLSLFEEVLADEACGSYPHALDQAAHCAFMVGDDVRGRGYAKRAHDLGQSTTYAKWRAGTYRKTGQTSG